MAPSVVTHNFSEATRPSDPAALKRQRQLEMQQELQRQIEAKNAAKEAEKARERALEEREER